MMLSGLKFKAAFDAINTLFQLVYGMSVRNGFSEIISTIAGQTRDCGLNMSQPTQDIGIPFARADLLRLNFLEVLEHKIVNFIRHKVLLSHRRL
jgi:hypothetical protein